MKIPYFQELKFYNIWSCIIRYFGLLILLIKLYLLLFYWKKNTFFLWISSKLHKKINLNLIIISNRSYLIATSTPEIWKKLYTLILIIIKFGLQATVKVCKLKVIQKVGFILVFKDLKMFLLHSPYIEYKFYGHL
jgi:hypothetical protein